MSTERDRVICVSLTEEEWQAFVAKCPQPVDWLRQQILAQLASPIENTPAASAKVSTRP